MVDRVLNPYRYASRRNRSIVDFSRANPTFTLREIAVRFDVTAERIRQIHRRMLYHHDSQEARKMRTQCVVPECDETEMVAPSSIPNGWRCPEHIGWISTISVQGNAYRYMDSGTALRLKNHKHIRSEGKAVCNFHQNIITWANYQGLRYTMRHEGKDLLVFRWPDEITVVEL